MLSHASSPPFPPLPPPAESESFPSRFAYPSDSTVYGHACAGYDCLAVDLVPAAIERGRALEAALWAADAGGGGDQDGVVVKQRVEWVAGDMFTSLLPEVRKGREGKGKKGLMDAAGWWRVAPFTLCRYRYTRPETDANTARPRGERWLGD